MIEACPACDERSLEGFHTVEQVPTNSCLLLDDEASARAFPRGRLDLAWCTACGFMTNRAFEPELAEYSGRYEETQSFSPRFVSFGKELAQRWVQRHHLTGKHVVEVGCGKGEFLLWMAQAGIGSGIGIDPGVHPERLEGPDADRLTFIADLYGESDAGLEMEALVCRHTLEHIHPVREFLSIIRANVGDQKAVMLFELPDTLRVLEEVAFWDTYYEHCSYFTAGSLVRLFRRCGFEIIDVDLGFDEQYLLLDASPTGQGAPGRTFALEEDLDLIRAGVKTFADGYAATVKRWCGAVEQVVATGGRVVVWGGGSKAVAFLTALGPTADLIAAAVDINPRKQGRFIAGTGHAVVGPEALRDLQPELVIAMNPIYRDEITASLRGLGVEGARLEALAGETDRRHP